MSEFLVLVLSVTGIISAGVANVVSINRSAAKVEQLQAERTINKEVQDVQDEVLSSTDSSVRARLQRWTK